jgi:hypothetical protein
MSRFWVQNIFDVVQIVALPQVNSPKVFIAIWFANSFGNVAFLGKQFVALLMAMTSVSGGMHHLGLFDTCY